MFINKFSEEEFVEDLKVKIKLLKNKDKISKLEYLEKSIKFITLSVNILHSLKMTEEVDELKKVLKFLKNYSEKDHDKDDLKDSLGRTVHDPHTENLTSKDAVRNLKQTGVMMDHQKAFDTDSHCADCGGYNNVNDGNSCQYCNDAIDSDNLFCSQECEDKAQDCGMVYDCMSAWDTNDAKCSGWKKSPVGSPRQRAFCKRHCGMKKKLTSKEVADDPDSCINQGLRRWKCRCS